MRVLEDWTTAASQTIDRRPPVMTPEKDSEGPYYRFRVSDLGGICSRDWGHTWRPIVSAMRPRVRIPRGIRDKVETRFSGIAA